MSADPAGASHTELTRRNFASFARVILLTTSVGAGFGAVDLAMIAPLGVDYVAAVGVADLIVLGLSAYATGLVAVFSSRLAMAEGEKSLARRLPVLVGALLLCAVVFQVVAVALALGTGRLLHLAQQNPTLVPLIVDYVAVRLFGIVVPIVWASTGEALRICGKKNISFRITVYGFVGNAVFDYVFLHTGLSKGFSSPAQAVAVATMIVYAAMAVYGVVVFRRIMRERDEAVPRATRAEVVTEFRSMIGVSQGVGLRNLNDYMSAIIPFLFIGTLGPQVVAASAVGAKVYTLFCRVPQSCVAGTSVFYSYEVGRGAGVDELRAHGRRLLIYTAVPTAIGTVVVLALSPWLVRLFGGTDQLDVSEAVTMLVAFMLTIPLYVLEATYTAILTVHQRGGLLSATSTVATYALMIPLAWYSVFVLKSAFWAIALGSVAGTVLIVVLLARALYRDHWQVGVPALAEVGGA